MGLYEDIKARQLADARNGFVSAQLATEPAEASARVFEDARAMGVPIEQAAIATPQDKAEFKANKIDWNATIEDSSRSAFLRSMGKPHFASATRDNALNFGLMERAAWWLAGDPGSATGSITKALRNGLARGLYTGANITPLIGNVSDLRALGDELRLLDSQRKRLLAGESNAAVFGDPDNPEQPEVYDALRAKFDAEYEAKRLKITGDIYKAADRASFFERMNNLFPRGAETEKFMQAEGFSDSAREFFFGGNFISNMANLGVESAVEFLPVYAPMLFAGYASGGASLLPMATTGAYSFGQDRAASLMEKIHGHGVNTMDGKALAEYFIKGDTYSADTLAADAHAGPVSVLDAASLGMAKFKIPATAGKGFKTKMPATARAYENAMGNAYVSAGANFLAQSQIQGVMGGAGEALGQMNAEGKITSWSDIIAEYAGEHFTAPLEVFAATRGAMQIANFEKAKAKANTNAIKAINEAVKQTDGDGKMNAVVENFGQEIEADHQGAAVLEVDVSSLHQTQPDVVEKIKEAIPSLTQKVAEAIATGGKVSIPLSTFMAKISPRDFADTVAEHTSISGDKSIYEAVLAEKAITADAKAQVINAVGPNNDAHKKSLKTVAKAIEATFSDSGANPAEQNAVTALVTSHISNMALELGMTPEQVWETYGISAVLSETNNDVGRGENGKITLNSKKAKRALTGREQRLAQANAGDFIPDANTIIRWANADRSTLLHEVGHWFMYARIRAAMNLKAKGNLTPAQQRFVDVTEKAVMWMSGKNLETFAAMPIDKTRFAHEKFARTFEQYLADGHAPNSALVTVFNKFKNFLKEVYKLLKVPGAEMNPEVAQMFDDLFTTSEQVREAQLRRTLFLNLRDIRIDENGDFVNKETNEKVKEFYDLATEEAQQKYIERKKKNVERFISLRESVVRRLSARAERIRKGYRDEIKREIADGREEKAIAFFNSSVDVNGKKIRPRLFVNELPGATKEQIESLRKKGIVVLRPSPGCVPASFAAEKLGYTSVDEFLSSLSAYESPTKEEIEARVEARMAEEFPELSTQESILETAEAAVFNPSAERVVAAEIQFLEGREDKRVTAGVFEEMANVILGGRIVSELKPNAFRDAASKAAREAKDAYRKNDMAAAANAKRRQLLQMALARLARRLKDDFASAKKALSKRYGNGNPDSVHVEYSLQIRSILGALDVIKNPPEAADSRVAADTIEDAYLNFVKAHDESLPNIPAEVMTAIREGASIDDMTVQQAKALFDFVNTLDKAGRQRLSFEKDGKKVSLDALWDDVMVDLEAVAQEKGLKEKGDYEATRGDKPLNEPSHWLRKIGSLHVRIPSLLAMIEGKRFGKLYDAITKRFDSCRDKEEKLRAVMTEAMKNAFGPLMGSIRDHKQKFYSRLNASLTKSQLIAIALNCGNKENLQRLIEGSGEYPFVKKENGTRKQWTEEDILATLGEALTEEELKAVQAVWDVVGSLWDDVVALERRAANRDPVEVKPSPITITRPDGTSVTLSGGYYPAVYDIYLSNTSSVRDIADNALDALSAARGKARVTDGRVKARTGGQSNPISLTFRAGFEGLDSIIHDLSWREAIADANKFFDSKGPVSSFIRKYWGKEYEEAIHKWIENIAAGNKKQGEALDTISRVLRQNISVAGLGFNLITALVQPIGFTQTVAVIGAKWSARGLGEWMKNPKAAKEFAISKSLAMESRARTQFRELAEIQNTLNGNRMLDAKDRVMRAAYGPIIFMQSLVDVPTWLGAYHKALSEGKTDADAVSYADRVLVDAQGGGSISDLSNIEAGGPTAKLFTVFYTFFNTALNIALVSGNTEKGLKRIFNLALLLCVQPMLESFLRAAINGSAGDDDWDKDLLKEAAFDALEFNLGLFVGLRELTGIIDTARGESNFGYSGPSGLRAINDLYKFARQAGQGEIDAGLVKSAISLMSDFGGLPGTPINRAISAYEHDADLPSYLFGYRKY